MSFKVEVQADSSDEWCSNALRFATRDAAESYARDLWSRWTAVRAWRLTETDEPVTAGLEISA